MVKKNSYIAPAILGLIDDGDETIDFGGSQGTSGTDNQWSFADDLLAEFKPEELYEMFSDEEFAEMDTDGNYVISLAEYNAYMGF